MILNNFTSFLEIGATLTVAFVAVEYAQQYTNLVAKKVFDFYGRIKNQKSECEKLIDIETIYGLSSSNINGHDTMTLIEKLKRETEIINSDILKTENQLNKIVSEKCNSKSYSAISLFIFLCTLTAIFIAGLGENNEDVRLFWQLYTILALIYIVFSWFLGEKTRDCKWIDFCSLKSSFYKYLIILTISTIAFLLTDNIELFSVVKNSLKSTYDIIVIITLFLPFANFIIFALIIKSKSKEIYSSIDLEFEPLRKRCEQIQNDTARLSNVQSLVFEMEVEDNNSTNPIVKNKKSNLVNNKSKKQQSSKNHIQRK